MFYNLTLKPKSILMWHEFVVFTAILVAPIVPSLIVTGVFIIADLATGIWASKKAGRKITSRRLRDTIDKAFVYNVSIILAFLIEKYMMKDAFPILRVVLGLISLAEFKSVSENLHEITGIDLYKKAVKYLKKKHNIEL